MTKYHVSLDRTICIGCGACTIACSNFVTDGNKAKVVKEDVDELGANKDAAESCPVNCIKVEKRE